jgi:hypothetical protein
LLISLLCVACGPGESSVNPPRFWITTDGSELRLRLTPVEPVPF